MADSIRKRLARAVRVRREELGLTQEAAAEACGVSVRYWRAVEAAGPSISLDLLEKVLTGLDWSWHDLAEALEATDRLPSGPTRQLERAWSKATPREKELVLAMLKVLGAGRR